ncbi:MAG: hypothetical protein K2X87_17130 [Gemmataceae bacterium]|nr:hypothetical protein [Gemmataceae bacterium]
MSSRSLLAIPAGALVVLGLARADEAADRQRKAAEANLAKAEVGKLTVAETENLFLLTPLPEARAKAVAGHLQKAYAVARKGLRFDPKDEPWAGKLAVYHLPERADFTRFMRAVAGAKPDDPYHVAVRGDAPYVLSGSALPAKAADADVAAELGPPVGAALLVARVGPSAKVPEWVRGGYGRAAALRAEGTGGKRFGEYKKAARAAALGGGGSYPARAADAWAGDRPDADVVATSLMDYLAFGPPAAKFPKFLDALKPDENGNIPDISAAVEAGGGKMEVFEAGWRRWVQAGMAVR